MIVKAACEGSYRAAARSVSEMTGQTISHTAAWNVVQQLGERVDAREQEAAAQAAKSEGKGTLETKLLFEELCCKGWMSNPPLKQQGGYPIRSSLRRYSRRGR